MRKFIQKAKDDLRAQIVYQRDYLIKVLRGRLKDEYMKSQDSDNASPSGTQQRQIWPPRDSLGKTVSSRGTNASSFRMKSSAISARNMQNDSQLYSVKNFFPSFKRASPNRASPTWANPSWKFSNENLNAMNEEDLRGLVERSLIETFFKKMGWEYDKDMVLPDELANKTTYSNWPSVIDDIGS